MPRTYETRSELEQAIIAGLINANFSFNEILELFIEYPAAGKFKEMHMMDPTDAIRWLKTSYREVKKWTLENESISRQKTMSIKKWAEESPWSGRTGMYDRAVFIAHTTVAYRAGSFIYVASVRDLADIAGVSRTTANKATNRLINEGRIFLIRSAVADLANTYRLNFERNLTLPHKLKKRKCQRLLGHDAFRWSGLGMSALEVYQTLQDSPLSTKEIEQRTGRHISTVRRVLNRMSSLVDIRTGEKLELVKKETDGKWSTSEIDLDHVALILGTAGMAEAQRRKHSKERRNHRISLLRGSIKNNRDRG